MRNEEHAVPPDVTAVIEDALARSFRAAQADQELKAKVTQANTDFRREQARLLDSLVKQLGAAETVKELDALRERHIQTVTGLTESAASAARGGRARRR
jgi:hypothetical protein